MTECKSCKYWLKETPAIGKCRKSPPIPVFEIRETVKHYGVWPATAPSSWCGEYISDNLF